MNRANVLLITRRAKEEAFNRSIRRHFAPTKCRFMGAATLTRGLEILTDVEEFRTRCDIVATEANLSPDATDGVEGEAIIARATALKSSGRILNIVGIGHAEEFTVYGDTVDTVLTAAQIPARLVRVINGFDASYPLRGGQPTEYA